MQRRSVALGARSLPAASNNNANNYNSCIYANNNSINASKYANNVPRAEPPGGSSLLPVLTTITAIITYIHTYMHTHIYIYIYIHTHIYAYIYIYIHFTYLYIYIYIHVAKDGGRGEPRAASRPRGRRTGTWAMV